MRKIQKYQSPANALSAFMPMLAQSYMSNQWATQADPNNPKGLAKAQQQFAGTKLGKGLSSNLGMAGLGVANAVIKDPSKNVSTDASTAVEAGLAGVADAFAPGLGTAVSVLGKATRALTRDSEGRYKSKFGMVAENINPINLVGNLIATKGKLGKTNEMIDKKIRRESMKRMREKKSEETLANAQSNALALSSRNAYGQGPAFFQSGGKFEIPEGLSGKVKVGNAVFDLDTAVGKKMFSVWAEKNPEKFSNAMKNLGYTETLPEYTIYASKDEETQNALEDLKRQGVSDAYALWGTQGAPNIRTYEGRAHYLPGFGGTMYINSQGSPEKAISEYYGISESDADAIYKDTMDTIGKLKSEGKKEEARKMEDALGMVSGVYDKENFFAELAHSKQFKERPVSNMVKFIADLALYEDKERYRKEGSLENEAHSEIQPYLTSKARGLSGVGRRQYVKFEKGGKMAKKKGCGCNKGKDGIDTDVFKHVDGGTMKKVQKAIGTVQDGKYKDSDKEAMKRKAEQSGLSLRDWLMRNSGVFDSISKAESSMLSGNIIPRLKI